MGRFCGPSGLALTLGCSHETGSIQGAAEARAGAAEAVQRAHIHCCRRCSAARVARGRRPRVGATPANPLADPDSVHPPGHVPACRTRLRPAGGAHAAHRGQSERGQRRPRIRRSAGQYGTHGASAQPVYSGTRLLPVATSAVTQGSKGGRRAGEAHGPPRAEVNERPPPPASAAPYAGLAACTHGRDDSMGPQGRSSGSPGCCQSLGRRGRKVQRRGPAGSQPFWPLAAPDLWQLQCNITKSITARTAAKPENAVLISSRPRARPESAARIAPACAWHDGSAVAH